MNSQTISETDFINDGAVELRTCDQHGSYESTFRRINFGPRKVFWTNCPKCVEATKRAEEERREAERRAEATAEFALHVKQMQRQSGIPARYLGKGFDDFVAESPAQRAALHVTRKYATALAGGTEPRGSSLLLIGKPGCGKTHLACAIGQLLTAAGKCVRYSTSSDLARRMRATFSREPNETESEVFEELATCRMLILDELGAGVPSEHERKLAFELIDVRYRELRPTVLISNLPVADLAQAIGERVVDRLREIAATVAFDWKSHRGVA